MFVMAEFIEDPAIAGTIADLKRRCPAIGDAADHPLAEFFIHRQKSKPRRGRQDKLLMGGIWLFLILAFLAGLGYSSSFASFFAKYNGFLMIAFFMGGALHRKFRKPPRRNDLTDPIQMLAEAGDVSQWEHLWLAPLAYRDLAGVCLGVYYHRKTASRAWPWRLILRVFFWLAACVLVATFFMDQIRFMQWVTCYGYPAETASILAGLVFLIYSAHRLFTDTNYHLCRVMGRISGIVMQRQQRLFVAHEFWKSQWRRGCGIALFMIILQINVVSCCVFASRSWGWVYIAASMAGWGLVARLSRRRFARMDISAIFEEFIAREERQYQLLVCQMIGR